MSNHVTKIATLVSNVNIATNLAKIFNIHLGHIHYTHPDIPYDEKLFNRDQKTINYILYRHPASILWKKPHPTNVKSASTPASVSASAST